MEIPLEAKVYCTDGVVGETIYTLVNHVINEVTHVVVREKERPHIERMVPINLVVEATHDTITLKCSTAYFGKQELFNSSEFIQVTLPPGQVEYLLWPYVVPETRTILAECKRIPPHELAVRRGAHVEATDGRVGKVDEFLIDPGDGHITHLVLREGHLWGQTDVTIPISEIEHVGEQTVYLKLDRQAVQGLPAIPVHRHHLI